MLRGVCLAIALIGTALSAGAFAEPGNQGMQSLLGGLLIGFGSLMALRDV